MTFRSQNSSKLIQKAAENDDYWMKLELKIWSWTFKHIKKGNSFVLITNAEKTVSVKMQFSMGQMIHISYADSG